MLTGIGAIGAAAVSIFYLRKQIAYAAIQETARRARRFTAARARLPLLLSDTTQYAKDAMDLLRRYLDAAEGQDEGTEALANEPRPVLPDAAILSFETIIETTEDDKFANVIADMISQMQVLNSRLRGLVSEPQGLSSENLQSYLMNAAKVYGYAASMYEFARRETNEPPHRLNWDNAISGLRLQGMYEYDYRDLHAFMGRARDRDHAAEEAG